MCRVWLERNLLVPDLITRENDRRYFHSICAVNKSKNKIKKVALRIEKKKHGQRRNTPRRAIRPFPGPDQSSRDTTHDTDKSVISRTGLGPYARTTYFTQHPGFFQIRPTSSPSIMTMDVTCQYVCAKSNVSKIDKQQERPPRPTRSGSLRVRVQVKMNLKKHEMERTNLARLIPYGRTSLPQSQIR